MQAGVGIIGYGFMGRVHAYSYRSIPLYYESSPVDVRLVAVATSSAATAEAARRHGGFETSTDDWRRLLERKGISIVNICSPNGLHAEQLKAALAAGKHIYCDKPLTVTLAEAEEVRRGMAGWNGIGQVALNNRFFSGPQRAKQLIDEGFLGTVTSFRAMFLHSGSVDPAAPLKWKLRGSEGGGVLRDLGSHLLDFVDWLVGPVRHLRAESRILHAVRPDGRGGTARVDAEDQVILTARLTDGAMGTMEASKIATGTEDDLRVELHGSRGAVRLDLMQPDFVEIFSLDDAGQPFGGTRGWKRIAAMNRYPSPGGLPNPRITTGWLRSHVHSQYTFLKGIAEGRQPDPSLERGVRVQRLIDCAERSARSSSWVEVGA
jgi:predicted dehydrogenase